MFPPHGAEMHHVPRTALCAVPGLRALLPGQCDTLRQAEKDDVVQDRLAGPRLQQVVGQSRLARAHAAQALCLGHCLRLGKALQRKHIVRAVPAGQIAARASTKTK